MKNDFLLNEEVINLEWAAKNEIKPPKGIKYQYKVDDVEFISETETLTGREILEKAGKMPAKDFILRQKLKGTWTTVELNDKVNFTEPGIEKFKTLPTDQTEGETKSLRRDFVLLEEDQEFLDSLGLPWEAIKVGHVNWVLVQEYDIVEGYNISKATLGIRMDAGYPTAQLDMVYFYPKLTRADGQPIGGLTDFTLEGKVFQQWSRHRTAANPWRPGLDNLSTHYPLAQIWLFHEFKKRPSYVVPA